MANELEAAAAKLPPDIAADMGVSPELIAGLRQNAKAVLGASDSAKERRGEIATRPSEDRPGSAQRLNAKARGAPARGVRA